MRPLPMLLAVTVVSVTAACVAQAPTPTSPALRTLLDEDWRYWMAQYPELATSVGYPGHDGAWTDYAPEAIASRADRLRETAARLAAVDPLTLPAEERLTYDLYLDLIQTAADGLAFDNDALPIRGVIPHNLRMPVNQLEGVQQDIPRTISLMPAATLADYERIVERLEGAPRLVDQTLALLRQGLARGYTPPRITLRDVPAQVDAQIVTDPTASPLLAAVRAFPAAVAEADRERLTRRATAAYADGIRPAFVRLRDFLRDIYLPACRESTAVSDLPDGAAMYAYNVRWHTTLPDTPAEIHALGLAEVERLRAAMDQVMAEAGFTGSFDAFKRRLRTAPEFFHRDAGALVRGYRDIAKRADPELARLFGVLPRTPYGVVRVPDAIAPSQTTAYYEPGALVAGRPGNMYANTYLLEARPVWEMEALTLHEAVPGHHLQIALAQELDGLPDFRRHASYTAFVEGWALYAESLGDEMGLYADPYAKFGQLTYEMWRAVRLVVDTGLHAMGWTREQAIAFFAEHAAKTEQDITVEVDRYIVWPAQALGYKMGQLQIRDLRAEAEQALGPRFDIRRFHDTVLGQGAVPLGVLEQRVRDWTTVEGSGGR
jgi:uncharacterized protein (DUF885 family)